MYVTVIQLLVTLHTSTQSLKLACLPTPDSPGLPGYAHSSSVVKPVAAQDSQISKAH